MPELSVERSSGNFYHVMGLSVLAPVLAALTYVLIFGGSLGFLG